MHKKLLWLRLKNYNFSHLAAPNLWQKLSSHFGKIDAPNLAFAAKLSRKHGWKQKFSLLAIREYKKFIFLGIVSDFQVTPSEIIDTVWHEHLLFTKAYRDFCKEVIEYSFDHHPELIPVSDQTDIFRAQYEQTLELYKSEFGIDPPEIIWGKTKFDIKLVDKKLVRSVSPKKTEQGTTYTDPTPLILFFETEMALVSATQFPEFNGGDFGGGGSGTFWGDGDAGDSSGDSGGDSSCSSCSSGCGGGD